MLGGERPYAGTWSVLTEAKQCRAYRLTEGKGHHEVREIEEGIQRAYDMLGLDDLETYTVDNAAEMEALLAEIHSSLRVERELTRTAGSIRFDSRIGKQIRCVKTDLQVGPALDLLDMYLQDLKVVGFDMEWDVDKKKKGPQAKTATIQLCVKDYCIIFQMSKLKRMPDRLKKLLEDPEIMKVGLNITGDRAKLLGDWCTLIANEVELKGLADLKLGHASNWSLANLCELVLGKTLAKPEHIRVSTNWSNTDLSQEQQEYAAIDAYAGLLVHQRLLETADMLTSFNNPEMLEKLEATDIEKMKVKELQASLQSLMMDKQGRSAELKARLLNAVRRLQGKADVIDGDAQVFAWYTVQEPTQHIKSIAEGACVDLFQLIRLNKGRVRKLSRTSTLEEGTLLLLPPRIADKSLNVEHELDLMDADGAEGASGETEACSQGATRWDDGVNSMPEHITRVKADIFHLLQRYGKSVPTRHPLRGAFMRCMRDAFFINSKSDYDAVKAHLVRRGMKDVDELGRRFFVKRVRRVVPKPSELAHRVESVYRVFTGKGTAKHGLLFKDGKTGTAAVHASVMDTILGGYASDFSADLYNETSVDQHGLRKYSVSRSSSALEGFHYHLRSCIPGVAMPK